MIYERRYNGKKPYGRWEQIDRETYETLYRAFYPRGQIGNAFQRCVYEYRRREAIRKPCDSASNEAGSK